MNFTEKRVFTFVEKKCRKCGQSKPLSDFAKHINGKYGVEGRCKECNNLYRREKYATDVQYKERALRRNRKRWYGLSDNELNKLLSKTTCDICGDEFKSTKDKHIDHDHNTNKVRGVLCQKCNLFLGNYELNLHLLTKINSYLS